MPCQTTAHHSPISSPNTWRDLGRSDEVAGGADRAGPRPVAVLGIGEAQSHVALDRHGAVAADAPRAGPRAAPRRCRQPERGTLADAGMRLPLHQIIQMPTASIGRE